MKKKRNFNSFSKNNKRKFIILSAVVFVLIIMLSAGLIYFLRVESFKIQKISIQGNALVSKENINAIVSDFIQGDYLRLVPRENIFVFPKNKIAETLKVKYPRIRDISILRNLPNTILIKIIERKSAALFCDNKDKSSQANNCVFIDEDGYAFEKSPFFSGDIYIKFFDERDSENVSLGRQLISKNQFEKVVKFANFVKSEKINIDKIILEKDGLYKFYTTMGWYILLSSTNDSGTSFDNLKIVLNEQVKDRVSNLEYVDLRLENAGIGFSKAYYRFK